MTAKLTLFVVCCSAFLASALAQEMDSSTLRAKYGEPLARETFQVRPNIEAVVNYGTGHQVCSIEMSQAQTATRQEVDQVVDELAPPSTRGKMLNRGFAASGRLSAVITSYEHVTISEPQDPDHPGRRTSVTITFKRPDCH
jgi:hypothetical protein